MPIPLPEPLRGRMLAAAGVWMTWCGQHGVDPHEASAEELLACVMELRRAGVPADDLADLLDQAGWMTSAWTDLRVMALRKAL